jgi:hypothetical protein
VPPVRQQVVLARARVAHPARPAAPVLVDAQVRNRRQRLLQDRVRGCGERLVRRRPGDPSVPGRPGRGDAAVADLVPGLLQQPPRDLPPRRRPGERHPRALPVLACPAPLDQAHVCLSRTVADISRPRRP